MNHSMSQDISGGKRFGDLTPDERRVLILELLARIRKLEEAKRERDAAPASTR